MKMLSVDGPSRSPRTLTAGRPAARSHVEPLEDRRLMSVGTPVPVPHSAVRIETSLGRITLLLTKDVTPKTVRNFLSNYVNTGLYNNTVIHRAVPGFVVQMGGYKVAQGYPHIPTETPVLNEFAAVKDAAHGGDVNTRGTVAVALSGSTNDTGTSEFFINLADNAHFIDQNGQDNGLDVQNGGFTTFARVIGGGIHVADAIAGLRIINGTNLNQAFSDLPVLPSATGTNPVTISSVKPQTTVVVRVGDSHTKFVDWVDEKGGHGTISLTGGGKADLTFVGGNNMRTSPHGNRITVTGKNLDLDEIDTINTTKDSTLAIKSVGGQGPAHIGDIIVGGSLGRIDADTVQIQGDITAAGGSIGRIDAQGTVGTTILTNGGALSLNLGTAYDTTVNTSGDLASTAKPKGRIKSLVAQKWVDDGRVPTSIVTGTLGSMEVNGDFSSTLRTSRDVGTLKINGNVGAQGASKWTIGGNARNIQVGKVMGLTADVGKDLGNFRAREVLSVTSGSNTTPTTISAKTIGRMTLATLTNQSTIDAIGRINSVAVTGLMDSSIIRAGHRIGSVSAESITGNVVNADRTALIPSGIYAGVVPSTTANPVTFVSSASQFKNTTGTIGSVTVQDKFSNTNIAAPTLGILDLATVQASNFTPFGVTAGNRIGLLTATVKDKDVLLQGATTNAAVKSYFKGIGLKIRPLGKQGEARRFNVRIV